MQETKALRIWQWSVILLVLCNIGLILTIWLHPHMEGRPGEGPRDYIIHKLQFTDAQVKEYDVLIKDHRRAMRRLQKEGMAYRQQLFSCLKNNNQEYSVVDSLAQLIANNQKQIELVTYHHFEQVRKIATDSQKADFDNIIESVIKKMNGHGGPPPDVPGSPPPDDRHP